LLLSGFLGRLTYDQLAHVIGWLPSLCTTGTAVLWTRHHHGNLGIATSRVHNLFRDQRFEAVKFAIASPNGYEVGWHRYIGAPQTLDSNLIVFNSVPVKIRGAGRLRKPQDSGIGTLTFDRGRWTTRYRAAGATREIRIFLNTTEGGPMDGEILAVQRFVANLAEHTRTIRGSVFIGWSYYPERIAAKRNGDLQIRYRSSRAFCAAKATSCRQQRRPANLTVIESSGAPIQFTPSCSF